MKKNKYNNQPIAQPTHNRRLRPLKRAQPPKRYKQGEEKDSDNENDRNNGLRMKDKMTMKEKRFSFFADQQERKAKSSPTFGTLPFAQHTSQRIAKVKEPNLSYAPKTFIQQSNYNFTVCLTYKNKIPWLSI